MILSLISFILVLFSSFFLSPPSALASNEFKTDFESTYRVTPDNDTQVTHTVTLTNNLSHLYPTEYTIYLGSINLDKIRVTQDGDPILFNSDTGENSTTITMKNLNPVIGQGQSTHLTLSYTTPDIAEFLGRTWSINIPRLSHANEIENFIRTVIIPSEIGLPTAQFPTTNNITSNNESHTTTLTYKGYPNHSLTLLFGDSEYYELNLTYHIDNPTLAAADTEIALPPDTSYQRVYLESLTPQPRHTKVDKDGNWLAVYPLKSKEKLQVQAHVFIQTFPLPQTTSNPPHNKEYLSASKYWETKSDVVSHLSSQLSGPDTIYDYVVSNLIYDYARASSLSSRVGASDALNNPTSAICTEFTDSFIALARAKDIPARAIIGYAYTTNPALRPLGLEKDVLHAWADYYDPSQNAWVQVDPTWGYTTGGVDYFRKLDFNHLTFAILGSESDYPLPAGAYKFSPDQKTIEVKLVDQLPETKLLIEETEHDGATTYTNIGNVSYTHELAGYLPPLGTATISKNILGTSISIPQLLPWAVFFVIIIVVFLILHRLKNSSSLQKPS